MPLLPKPISLKFRFLAFISILAVVFIHSYNLKVRNVKPWTLPCETLTPTTFTEYFLSNGVLRFVVPLLFLISGYLYSLHDDMQPYWQRLKRRLRVLFLPYIIWSATGMVFLYIMMSFPTTRTIVMNSHILPETNSRLIHNSYHWYDFFTKWILIPVPYQLWFIRVLIIYNLAYPVLRWCITHKQVKFIFFSILIFLWVNTFSTLYVEGEGLLFFSLGIWMQKTNFNIETPPRFLNPFIWSIVFVVISIVKTVIAFEGSLYFNSRLSLVLEVMQKMTIFSGLVTVWYGSTSLATWFMRNKWFMHLSSFSFIIYVMHAPAIAIGISWFFAILKYVHGYRILTYTFLPIIIISISISFGALVRKLFPRFYAVLTGGRGL